NDGRSHSRRLQRRPYAAARRRVSRGEGMTAERVRTLVVEDEPEARRTLREYLDDAPWIEVVGESADGRDAVARIDRLEPALVVLDVHLPELSGLRYSRRSAISLRSCSRRPTINTP